MPRRRRPISQDVCICFQLSAFSLKLRETVGLRLLGGSSRFAQVQKLSCGSLKFLVYSFRLRNELFGGFHL